MKYSEDINYLTEWINNVLSKISLINKQKKNNEKVIFMIGNTADFSHESKPYITPIRKISIGYVFGSIVYSQAQAAILSLKIDGLVDFFFIDVEKKLPLIESPDIRPYEHFNIDNFKFNKDIKIELGNISATCKNVISISPMYEYKGNDITVESVWLYLVNIFADLSGLKVVIYGSGNIGNKLTLKLVESGANIHVVTKNKAEFSVVSAALNIIKHKYVLSNISTSMNDVYSSIGADIIIGCTNSIPVIIPSMVEVMDPNGVVVDVGKGTITTEAIQMCSDRNIKTWRADITPMIESLVISAISMNNLLKNEYGRRKLECGVHIVSGGYIGNKYDVIVDSYLSPSTIFGVCSEVGRVFEKNNKKAKDNILMVEDLILSIQS